MKVCMVTDLYGEFIGGVPLLCVSLYEEFKRQGHDIKVIYPSQFEYGYNKVFKEIKTANNAWTIKERLEEMKPDFIFVMGEVNLSAAAITYCRLKGIPFLTFYQTKFPEFVEKLMSLPHHTTYRYLDWYHYKASTVLSISDSMTDQLLKGTSIRNIKPWFGGVDTEKFNPSKRALMSQFNPDFETWKKPILLCVSRCSPEKNIEAFLSMNFEGTKVYLGDGPLLEGFKEEYPEAKCLGSKSGDELSAYYASADVFVFSSKCDAFGMVNIEALASGTPVVGFNATGVRDIVEVGVNGYLAEDDNLEISVKKALQLDRSLVHKTISKWTLKESVELIIVNAQLMDQKRWVKFNNPTLTTLLDDFQSGIQLLALAAYLYLLHLIYGIFNVEGVKDSFLVIFHSWIEDSKKVLGGTEKKSN